MRSISLVVRNTARHSGMLADAYLALARSRSIIFLACIIIERGLGLQYQPSDS